MSLHAWNLKCPNSRARHFVPGLGTYDALRTTYTVACREIKGMSTDPTPNPEKPTDQWVTGQEPMTGPQTSYLQTLCREAGEEFDGSMTKAEASKKIEEVQSKTGRGEGS